MTVENGVMVDLMGRWCYTGPGAYTPGLYPSKEDRYRMWRLAAYYYVRGEPGSPGTAYFNPSFCNNNDSLEDYISEWAMAYETDIGDPLNEGRVIQEGQAGCGATYRIYARDYTFAKVLVRPQDSASCTDYGDGTAVESVLDEPMRILMADGSRTAPVSSVYLRNSEAVILMNDEQTPTEKRSFGDVKRLFR